MFEIFQMFILGFVIGLTGALAPGPTLVATINASIAGDWTTGLKVSLGHVIVELFLVILILIGLADRCTSLHISDCRNWRDCADCIRGADYRRKQEGNYENHFYPNGCNPYMAGLVTSAANPYFWIWWLSIGSAMVIAGLQGGLVLVGALMIGHWSADTVWLTLVSTGVSKGRTIVSDAYIPEDHCTLRNFSYTFWGILPVASAGLTMKSHGIL